MPRFGGPGRPPKVKETPVAPSVPVVAPPPPDSDDASSSTSEPMNTGSTNKLDPAVIINNNNTNNSTSNKALSTSSDVVVDHSYTAPQWLLQEKQTPKYFSIPIPPVSTEMFQAIQRLMGNRTGDADGSDGHGGNTTTGSTNTAAARQARLQTHQVLDKLRQLQQDHKAQSKKVLLQKEKLANAIARKQQGMEELRREKQVELDVTLEQLQDRMLSEATTKFELEQEKLKLAIQQQFEQEYEAEQQSLKKRKQQEQESSEHTKDHDKVSTMDKNVSKEGGTTTTTDAMEEGEELENEEPKAKQIKTESPKKELVSQQIQQKIDSCQAKLDSLQEKKSEMVWLLKQVIKADAKRKAEQLKLKKAATTPTAAGTTPATAAANTATATTTTPVPSHDSY